MKVLIFGQLNALLREKEVVKEEDEQLMKRKFDLEINFFI